VGEGPYGWKQEAHTGGAMEPQHAEREGSGFRPLSRNQRSQAGSEDGWDATRQRWGRWVMAQPADWPASQAHLMSGSFRGTPGAAPPSKSKVRAGA